MFELFLTKWLSKNFNQIGLGENIEGGELPFDLFWLLKSELELSISNQMSPVSSLNEHSFYENHKCPQGITYNACPRALGGYIDLGVFVIWSVNHF